MQESYDMSTSRESGSFSGGADAGRPPFPSCRNNMAVLEALDSLSSPSPSSSTDGINTAFVHTYGDIPIMLGSGSILHMSEAEDPASALRVTDINVIVDDDPLSTDCLPRSPSTDRGMEPLYSHNYAVQGVLTATGESQSSISPYIFSLSVHDDACMNRQSVLPAFPTLSSVASFSGITGVSPVASTSLVSFGLSPSSSLAYHQFLTEDTCRPPSPLNRHSDIPRSRSTTSTGTVGSSCILSPSPSSVFNAPWLSYGKTQSVEHRCQSHRLQKARSCYPLTTTDLNPRRQVLESHAPSSEPTTPSLPPYDLPPALQQHRRTESNSTSASNRSIRSIHSSHISSPLASPATKRRLTRNLPRVLDWLEDTRIELWMDQEGSHAVRQTFKLVGFTTGPPDDHDTALVDALTYGLAEYMPVMRRSFVFDSGKLDFPPTLRRVTVMGDDTKDYVSHQATLTTNFDGAYSVNGTEYFDLQRNRAPLVLRWRLEYFVQDGPRESEKTLTPLRFSCSPGLLHPSHGRKQAKMLQIFRRSSSARLFAEKIEIPRKLHSGVGLQERRETNDPKSGPVKENDRRGLGLTAEPFRGDGAYPDLALGSVQRWPSVQLRRSPRLSPTMLKPTTPTELMGLHAAFLRARGNGGCDDGLL